MTQPYYDDGTCTIYHGDCRSIWPELQVDADMVLTDPPYGSAGPYGRGGRSIANDDTIDVMLYVATELGTPSLHTDSWAVMFTGVGAVGPVQETLVAAGLEISSVGIWDKGMLSMGAGMRSQYEMFVLARKGKPEERYNGGNIWRCTRSSQTPEHPHEKPNEILVRLVDNYSPAGGSPGALIVDPCMGSGTTLRAAKDCGRRAIGIELEERYCEIAARNLGQEVLDLGV